MYASIASQNVLLRTDVRHPPFTLYQIAVSLDQHCTQARTTDSCMLSRWLAVWVYRCRVAGINAVQRPVRAYVRRPVLVLVLVLALTWTSDRLDACGAPASPAMSDIAVVFSATSVSAIPSVPAPASAPAPAPASGADPAPPCTSCL